ncbi:MAG: hypothetical protein HC927_12255 [Deltaproteobacteria bacterium]|nr:hypothetical protein [Deltaproteobacteria bacterium]
MRERVENENGHGRWQPGRRNGWGLRDVCSGDWIVPRRYDRLQSCGATHFLAYGDEGIDLYALERPKPFVARLDAELAHCEFGLVVTQTGGALGLADLDGRVWFTPRFIRIDAGSDSLLALTYFDLRVYVSTAGVSFFDEPLPVPGEFPETSRRVLTRADLRKYDRETLERMLADLYDRSRYFRRWVHHAESGPIETANIELLERTLAKSNPGESEN